jgi:hypothetical protein
MDVPVSKMHRSMHYTRCESCVYQYSGIWTTTGSRQGYKPYPSNSKIAGRRHLRIAAKPYIEGFCSQISTPGSRKSPEPASGITMTMVLLADHPPGRTIIALLASMESPTSALLYPPMWWKDRLCENKIVCDLREFELRTGSQLFCTTSCAATVVSSLGRLCSGERNISALFYSANVPSGLGKHVSESQALVHKTC